MEQCGNHSLEKTRNSLSHQKLFREINSLVTSLVKTLLSRNFCQKKARERIFEISILCFALRNFTWNQFRFTSILQFAFHSKFFKIGIAGIGRPSCYVVLLVVRFINHGKIKIKRLFLRLGHLLKDH